MNETVTAAAVSRTVRVAKDLVHKHDGGQVLLSGLKRLAEDEFLVAADWTDAGRLVAAGDRGEGSAVLLTETIRQTFPLLSHAGYDVPFDHRLLWSEYRYTLNLGTLREEGVGGRPDLHIRCHDVVRRRGRVSALSLDVTVLRDGEQLATAHTRFTIQPPAIYQRLRGSRGDAHRMLELARSRPLPPPVSGAGEEFRDVVLSPTDATDRWQLRIDTHHPMYFDHPADHAPGILLLEAAKQAVRTVRHPRVGLAEAMETVFHRYVELDSPCWVEARHLPDDQLGRARFLVTMNQEGQLCFTALVSVAKEPVG
ncbi:ScbA/BarX family gamma-butyrolactone biosynthesis protein [Streptomyces sp. NBC_00199]|uniref:ScbA/BarX family gamma-butyrolactone biosynthesis protein n=1 Tax=Streptomyces sp. NBC_00199 TaxID=2975678 RepID=UPI002258DAEA|nr:ScbA/BarX family gamma-butyrolactone biosynthesis protein [Streptomyces sp. NBC_00199]MCX5266361.1 ScbA/BarX family gamma-butyrolactone biosynthesis protein [Streptomyces sp. NBC_00199]